MSEKLTRVLVFPGGTEIGLEIHRALSDCRTIELYAAGQQGSNHAPLVFKNFAVVPSIFEERWIDELNWLVLNWKIDYIYPAHDDVLLALSENSARIKARIIASPFETCRVARFKSLTYAALSDVIRVPQQYRDLAEIRKFPVFLKPDRGQGSLGIKLAPNREALLEFLNGVAADEYLVLENLPGREYTVDCFSDRERGVLFVGGRERVRTRNGISMDSVKVKDPRFNEIAERIGRALPFYGAWFFQVKEASDGELALLEIAPRIAGAMALHRVSGVNFPLLSIYEQERIPIGILTNDQFFKIDRALVNRYQHQLAYSTVYIDLDDTLILKGAVNTTLIRFLYQSLNQGKRIVLITRHGGDLTDTLRRYRLIGIFDEIVHITGGNNKAEYIVESDSIFIDDSFSERLSVASARKIPTFDCSMVELLIDERV